MAYTSREIEQALEDVSFPARRRTLVTHARAKRVRDEVVNVIHRVPDRNYQSTAEVNKAIGVVADNEQRVWQTLDSPTPPVAALGDTTDYQQIVLAWGKRHCLGIDDLLDQLDQTSAPLPRELAAEIRSDPSKKGIFEAALKRPLSGGSASRDNQDAGGER